jgi:hypothetical protein
MAIGLFNYYKILTFFNVKHEQNEYPKTYQPILTSLTTHPVAVIIKQEILLMLFTTIIKYIKHYQNNYITLTYQ